MSELFRIDVVIKKASAAIYLLLHSFSLTRRLCKFQLHVKSATNLRKLFWKKKTAFLKLICSLLLTHLPGRWFHPNRFQVSIYGQPRRESQEV